MTVSKKIILTVLAATAIILSTSPNTHAKRKHPRDPNKPWASILGGPSYTPEASLGIGGAMLLSFKMNKQDTVSQRSFLPVGFNISLNKTIVVAGAGTFFFNEDKYRLYMNYSFRSEPSNYFGKGYESIEKTELGANTTHFNKMLLQLNPRFVWQAKPHFFIGGLIDISYTSSKNFNPVMLEDPYFQKFSSSYLNSGLGVILQYDTRDDEIGRAHV